MRLGAKLAGLVFDCGADPGTDGEGISSPEQFAYVMIDTIWMCIGVNMITVTDRESGKELSSFTPEELKTPIERACHAATSFRRNCRISSIL